MGESQKTFAQRNREPRTSKQHVLKNYSALGSPDMKDDDTGSLYSLTEEEEGWDDTYCKKLCSRNFFKCRMPCRNRRGCCGPSGRCWFCADSDNRGEFTLFLLIALTGLLMIVVFELWLYDRHNKELLTKARPEEANVEKEHIDQIKKPDTF